MARDDKTGYVYFMSNKSRMIYIGVTSDLDQRVGQHKTEFSPGYTKKYKMDRLVYVETFPNMLSAIARETQLKNWSRAKKSHLSGNTTRNGWICHEVRKQAISLDCGSGEPSGKRYLTAHLRSG